MGLGHVLCRSLNGHLPVLKYLHENGCPWDSDTCQYAAYHKHWDCLQYAVDNKCPEWKTYAKETRESTSDEKKTNHRTGRLIRTLHFERCALH